MTAFILHFKYLILLKEYQGSNYRFPEALLKLRDKLRQKLYVAGALGASWSNVLSWLVHLEQKKANNAKVSTCQDYATTIMTR